MSEIYGIVQRDSSIYGVVNVDVPIDGVVYGFAINTGGSGGIGTQGYQGAQGVQGAQGAQGANGNDGYQGAQGAQGTRGYQGYQGVNGTQGANGSNGTQGFQGAQGSTGTQGFQGAQGANGSNGTQGFQGAQGYQGAQGSTPSITGLVPYTGATGNLNLGENTLTTKSLSVGNGTDAEIGYSSTVSGAGSKLLLRTTSTDKTTVLSLHPNGTSTTPPSLQLNNTATFVSGTTQSFSFGTGQSTLPANTWNFAATVNGQTNLASWPIGFLVSNVTDGRFTAMTIASTGDVTTSKSLDVTDTYKSNGSQLFTNPIKSGSAGTLGQVLTSTGSATTPTWEDKASADYDYTTKLVSSKYMTDRVSLTKKLNQIGYTTVKCVPFEYNLKYTSTSGTLADGTAIYLLMEYIPEDIVITGVRFCTVTQGVFTADNFNGIGLYSVDVSSGLYTQVAITDDLATSYQSAAGTYTSAPFTGGEITCSGFYALCVLYNSSAQTTAPVVHSSGATTATAYSVFGTSTIKINGSKTGTTALPATINASTMSNATTLILATLY